ncbi:bifunctional ADP-dependent NAD(P)H-hydrate dehydratase/NAD(P)H-hydrate epimerase [Rahnella aquatilis]|nr:bifunctional ADP-dependent NAD(P)H-hydrate dehydratase/NAD(P)H-hydrate epimerase [Rahnella aquatilis]AZP40714.1 bifunctional ADP-dependent NAD(P)H-hydrate dehydratase/NAD(P)H-hydrate epimerase [Rahnella aquatilis]AZP45056.1 bifunctional ADP-dependent NAD(P)H-hydrate dehydratase/NAD(P)H-hydrate epimerase [Rahnella aquatilis]AZP49389.1 bifunctional ADP-dependent NAD(P)H-hydrate dehydratase/NAD(P)H-hydrate epimerase [Rahnella aquatilis]
MTNQREKRNEASLPHSVFSADWLRQAERQAAQETGISLFTLMQRAAKAAFLLAQREFPQTRHWLILCGHGNNGGDGFEVARLAKTAGISVTLLAVAGSKPLPEEAETARQDWLKSGGTVNPADFAWPQDADLIIDGLLGTGLSSAPRAPYDGLIEAMNSASLPVISLDIPSGLDAQTGQTAGKAVHATHTISFIALKPGLLTGLARDYTGKLHCDALGLESWLGGHLAPLQRLDASQLGAWLHPRRPCSHKGEHGRLLVVGGDTGFAGAIRMASEAALRSGAGLVRVLTHKENTGPLLTARPELMVQELTAESLDEGLEWADVLVIGPGLGQKEWGKQAVERAENWDKPALWDADALNLLAINPRKRQNRVLTPHPGEAARLLGCSVNEIESDRLLSAKKLTERYGGVVVLKGAGTLIASERGEMAVADVGNAGMASGGMGDVLSGIIGGLLAQKLNSYDAACAGSVVHGAAADEIAHRQGTRGMLATDLLAVIAPLVNPDLKK